MAERDCRQFDGVDGLLRGRANPPSVAKYGDLYLNRDCGIGNSFERVVEELKLEVNVEQIELDV
ncbi:hypothetical protein ACQKB2_17880 [Mycobacterium tuberculosis]